MTDQKSGKINIDVGGIGGNQQGIIAGRDVQNAKVTITIGGQETPADKTPNLDEFKQLLAEIQQEMADLAAQQEALKAISPTTSDKAETAQTYVKEVSRTVENEPVPEGESLVEYLEEAASSLGNILDRVNKKMDQMADIAKPLADKIGPLIQKLAVAALWAGKLWLTG